MQGGDISNEFQPTFLVIFEGLLGLPPDEEGRKKPWWKRRKADPKSVVADYTINQPLLGQIRRVPFPVEVVTFLGPKFAYAIEERLDELQAPVRRVWPTTPQELARIHLLRPDVATIYDPDSTRAFATYGGRGRHLLPQNAPRFGAQ